jgi:hypothetical protein
MAQLIDKGGEWEEIFENFDKLRRPNGKNPLISLFPLCFLVFGV